MRLTTGLRAVAVLLTSGLWWGRVLGAQEAADPLSRAPTFDERVRAAWQAPAWQAHAGWRAAFRTADLLASPGLVVAPPLAWGLARLADAPGAARVAWRTTESVALGVLVSSGLKVAFGRARPGVSGGSDDWAAGRGARGTAWQSFPSGHTTVAFAAATAVTLEAARTRTAVAPVALGATAFAATAGLARVYLDRHWLSDVVAGAAVGTAAALAVSAFHRTGAGARADRAMLGRVAEPRALVGLALGAGGWQPLLAVMP